MKKIFKILYPFIFPVTLVIFLLYSFKVIKLEYHFGYQSANVYQNSFSWQKQIFFSELKRFKNKIFEKKNKNNFPKVELFVSRQNSRKLLSDLPASTKKWVNAYISYPSNEINFQKINLRYRGDNPINWLKQKKQLRIKTRKNELINGYRHINYSIFEADKYLSYLISDKMDLINQNYNLVEIYINGETQGLYIEQEKIDEIFLRKNKLMPTNIYKGENNATETFIGLNQNLFNNPGLWSKLAVFNQENPDNFEDLTSFLKTLKSNKFQSDPTINEYIDLKYYSRLEAFLAIANNYHHDSYHNLRFVTDPWSGKITQLIIDPMISSNLNLDFSSNDLGTFLNKNTFFIHEKYKWIYFYLYKEDIIKKIEADYKKIKKDLKIINKKEPYDIGREDHNISLENNLLLLKNNKTKFLKILNSNPESAWNKNQSSFDIVLNDYAPLSSFKFFFEKTSTPKWVGIDLNYDNKISEIEPKFYLNKDLNFLDIPIAFYSNRFKVNNLISTNYPNFDIDHSKTYLKFISENNSSPLKVEALNFFNKSSFLIKEKNFSDAVKLNNFNQIINLREKEIKKKITLNGIINVDKNLIFNDEVIIQPGTKFLIKPGKHVVFKQKVDAQGTTSEPISFQKFDKINSLPWGSVAILGKKTMGSTFNNVIFSGGSGGYFNQYKFSSMFSVHNTKNIKILNSQFLLNELFDDTIHVIYSSDILFDNIEVNNAFGDALDVDISEQVNIKNSLIKGSKNDGLDFMESQAIIENLLVTNSEDKGISVGENSKVTVRNSIFKNNKIGAAIKDNSIGLFYDNKFLNNDIQIASYAKNWRYGSGGNVKVLSSRIESRENKFVTTMDPADFEKIRDKNLNQDSKINISNSEILGDKIIIGKNFSLN